MNRRSFLGLMAILIIVASAFAGKTSSTPLTITQKNKLLYMYQEEKVARDVYITLNKQYPTAQTFANILLAEQTHMDAVERLCVKYGIDISNVNEAEVGIFILPELQTMYNSLVSQGSISLVEGLKVGITIEEKDIKDLADAMLGMPTDVVNVFTNLRNGSYNHLSAFNNALSAVTKQ